MEQLKYFNMNPSQDKLKKVSELLKIHGFAVEQAFEGQPFDFLAIDSREAKDLFMKSLDNTKTNHSFFSQEQEMYFLKWMELTIDVSDVVEAYKIVFSEKLRNIVIRKLYNMV